MAGDPRVLGLLEEMLDAGKTPEEMCRGCPALLAEVGERWKEFRRIDAAVVELLPGLRTAPGGTGGTRGDQGQFKGTRDSSGRSLSSNLLRNKSSCCRGTFSGEVYRT